MLALCEDGAVDEGAVVDNEDEDEDDEDEDEGDEDAADAVAHQISQMLDDAGESDTDIISRFAVGGAIFDEATKKVIRNGEVKLIKKKKRKKRLSGKQRAAMKKMRMKAHKGSAPSSISASPTKR